MRATVERVEVRDRVLRVEIVQLPVRRNGYAHVLVTTIADVLALGNCIATDRTARSTRLTTAGSTVRGHAGPPTGIAPPPVEPSSDTAGTGRLMMPGALHEQSDRVAAAITVQRHHCGQVSAVETVVFITGALPLRRREILSLDRLPWGVVTGSCMGGKFFGA